MRVWLSMNRGKIMKLHVLNLVSQPWHYWHWGWIFSAVRWCVLCMVRGLAASLTSTHSVILPPQCDNQKCLRTWLSVPWEGGKKSSSVENHFPKPTILIIFERNKDLCWFMYFDCIMEEKQNLVVLITLSTLFLNPNSSFSISSFLSYTRNFFLL